MKDSYCIEVSKGKVVEVPKKCCYDPDDKGEVMFNIGGYSYARGPIVNGPPTHYFVYSGNPAKGSKLVKMK